MTLPDSTHSRTLLTLVVVLACAWPAAAAADAPGAAAEPRRSAAALEPARVVPSVSSDARGRIEVELDLAAGTLRYVLEYSDLEGGVSKAHLHFGQSTVTGGVIAWLCGSAADPGPPGTPACPVAPARLEGALSAAQVVGPVAQGVEPERFDSLAGAFQAGLVYVDVHSSKFGGGELRGQLPAARQPRPVR